jgi:menaquinone-specific isochorismate synthase
MSTTPAADEPLPAPLVVRTVALDDLPTGTDPADLLGLLPAAGQLAWVRRGDGLVGWGEAWRIEVAGADRFDVARAAWRDLVGRAVVRDEVGLPGTGPVAFGTFSFDERSARGGALVMPSVLVGRREGRTWVTTVGSQLAAPPRLDATAPQPVHAPGAVTQQPGAMTGQDWLDVIGRGVAAIRAGRLDKVVLARDVLARTEHPLDVRWALGRLADRYESCWTFSVDGLIGATPELLVRVERGLVTSRVLAGTIRRTGDDDADIARAAILAHSSKDLEEHEYAVSSVAHALAPFCSSTNVPDVPFVLSLPNVLHLASDVTGVLAGEHASSLAVAQALHPTAAVCGTPTSTALDLLRDLEQMDRGRYAGPVGWLGADGDGEWGIGLRSAQVDPADPHLVRLFAGCGVVAASDPAAELAESEAKLEPMRYALGLLD